MKPFKLTITWDKLRKGEFPEKELLELDSEMEIKYSIKSIFKEEITIETTIPEEENELEIAYSIGSLIETIIR